MFGFVQNWLAPRANPIGVDFGSDTLRLAQVQLVDNDYHLVAAASADVPSHVRQDPVARLTFFTETIRDLLSQGDFRGRSAILALPSSSMFVQHLRLPKMTEEALRKALPWEARGKLPIDPSQALLRHMVAGDIFQDQEVRSEVIVMAASRELVNQLLGAASKGKLDVVGMNVEPKAIVDCFQHVYRRKSDADVTNLFVDIGAVGTRAIIARGGRVLFARTIPMGGDYLNEDVARAMHVTTDEARLTRIKLCSQQPALDETRQKQQLCSPAPTTDEDTEDHTTIDAASMSGASGTVGLAGALSPVDRRIDLALAFEQASMLAADKLVDELNLCRRYHEATFPATPVDRLVFVGGESKQRGLCQHIAQGLGLAAQLGDPLVRMGRVSMIGIESGIDRRLPQPNWAVAIGLSMGPKVEATTEVR